MNSPDFARLNDHLGRVIGRALKQAVAAARPTPGARQRLLGRAALPSRRLLALQPVWEGSACGSHSPFESGVSWFLFSTFSSMRLMQAGWMANRLPVA